MNKILEIIKNEKVEWKKLGDVCEIKTGKSVSKAFIAKNEGIYPVINSGKEPLGYVNVWNTEDDPIGITSRGAGVGSITYQVGKYYRGNLNYAVTIKDNKDLHFRFLYHLLLNMQYSIHNLCSFNGIPALNASELKSLEIPIPSMETQERIVKILDTMVDHFTQLQAELQARNRQYEHYRDKLLSEEYLNKLTENNNIRKARLCEIAQLNRGKRVVRNQLSQEGLYPVFQNSLTPLGFYDNKNFSGEKTCIITAGAAGDIFYQEKDFWAADDVFVITTDEAIDKYLYYFILNKQFILKSKVRRASVPRLSRESIEGLEILVPPIPVQEHIVSILDNFNKIVTDINEGLPKEIELRQKQYEYYRERLLDFKREED